LVIYQESLHDAWSTKCKILLSNPLPLFSYSDRNSYKLNLSFKEQNESKLCIKIRFQPHSKRSQLSYAMEHYSNKTLVYLQVSG